MFWQTKKQHTVALSSAEAELMSLVEVVQEVLFFLHLLTQMKYNVIKPIVVNVDNRAAIEIASHNVHRARTKHINIRHYFIHDLIHSNTITLNWIEGKQQLADIFTKPLSTPVFVQHRDKLVSPIRE